MKNLMFTVLIMMITISSFAQSVSTTCNWNDAPLRVKPNVDSSYIIKVPIGAKINVIAKANDLYFKVSYKTDTGYMKIVSVIHVFQDKNGNDINNSKLFEKLPNESPIVKVNGTTKYYTDETITGARKLYGNEDETSRFQSNDYAAITLVWYCAYGRYRSITFFLKKGEYLKESEFVSDCILK